jgi:Mn-dependent DtxR family transcriptional regulator
MQSDQFPLTQEFIAQMLGVRRAGVTEAAGTLQQAGMIRYTRGKITILNREAMEATSCECYGVIKDEYARLLGTRARLDSF